MTANLPRDILDTIEKNAADVRALQGSLGRGAQPAVSSSTSRPANPGLGQPIYETDTGLTAYWNGSAWVYPAQRIAGRVLTSSQASITLSVPAGFSSIYGVYTARKDTGGGGAFTWMRLNGDAANDYQWVNQIGNSAPGTSGALLVDHWQMGLCAGLSDTATYFATGNFTIANASSTATAKPFDASSSLVCSTTTYFKASHGGVWNSTAAVTSVTLLPDSGNLVAGSSLELYGWY
jgi:hypothetical protein